MYKTTIYLSLMKSLPLCVVVVIGVELVELEMDPIFSLQFGSLQIQMSIVHVIVPLLFSSFEHPMKPFEGS